MINCNQATQCVHEVAKCNTVCSTLATGKLAVILIIIKLNFPGEFHSDLQNPSVRVTLCNIKLLLIFFFTDNVRTSTNKINNCSVQASVRVTLCNIKLLIFFFTDNVRTSFNNCSVQENENDK